MSAVKLVVYLDGQCEKNTNYCGYGVFGYTLVESPKPKSVNFPLKAGLKMTTLGVDKTPDKDPHTVVEVIDMIGSIKTEQGSLHLSRLVGLYYTLEMAQSIEDLNLVTVVLDYKGLHTEFNKLMKLKEFEREEDQYSKIWLSLYKLYHKLKDKGIKVKFNIVKSNQARIDEVEKKKNKNKPKALRPEEEEMITLTDDNDEGDVPEDDEVEEEEVPKVSLDLALETVELYSLIGANNAKLQYRIMKTDPSHKFNSHCYFKRSTIKEFKDQLNDVHFLYNYRNVIFHTRVDSQDHLFLNSTFTPDKLLDLGKRGRSITYALLCNDIPKDLIEIKEEFSQLDRVFDTHARINLTLLKKSKILARVIDTLGFEKSLEKVKHKARNYYDSLTTDGYVIEDIGVEYTHMMEVDEIHTLLRSVHYEIDEIKQLKECLDLTDLLYDVDKKKLLLKFADKTIDVTDRYQESDLKIAHRLIFSFKLDLPEYSVLKQLTGQIQSIFVYLHYHPDRNLVTPVSIIEYVNKEGEVCYLLQTNGIGKFLARS